MDYRVQTTVFAVIFILVGMMFLVPAGTEKALATIFATAKGVGCGDTIVEPFHACHFTFEGREMISGAMYRVPTQGTVAKWQTTGSSGIGLGEEEGWVQYNVEQLGLVKLHFKNPSSGKNTCSIEAPPTPGIIQKCNAGPGLIATFTYDLTAVPAPLRTVKGDATGFCGVPIHPCQFTFVSKQLPAGRWDHEPTQSGNPVTWMATSKPQTDLQGSVLYKVGGGEADLYFSNHSGGKFCVVNILSGKPYLNGSCRLVKEGGGYAEIMYNLRSPNE